MEGVLSSHGIEVTPSSFENGLSSVAVSDSDGVIPVLVDKEVTRGLKIEGLHLTNNATIQTSPFIVVSDVEFVVRLYLRDIS